LHSLRQFFMFLLSYSVFRSFLSPTSVFYSSFLFVSLLSIFLLISPRHSVRSFSRGRRDVGKWCPCASPPFCFSLVDFELMWCGLSAVKAIIMHGAELFWRSRQLCSEGSRVNLVSDPCRFPMQYLHHHD
jgi:hypothetical protein